MSKTAKKNNLMLWDKIVRSVKKGDKYGMSNSWNARKAQYAVKLYKKSGGGYIGDKKKKNSLVKWTKEDWQYSNENKKGRYLPKKIWDRLSSSEKLSTNRKKIISIKNGKRKAGYSEKIKKMFRRMKI